jgi:hypothetical protein
MDANELIGIVNASGFAFQIAVEHAVESSDHYHNFDIEAREHPWRHGDDRGSVDLILSRGRVRIICECKRTRDGNWLFLVEKAHEPLNRARLRWLKATVRGPTAGWDEFYLVDETYESSFCMVRGQGEGDRSLLERIASFLIESVESVADEEAKLLQAEKKSDDARIYIPMIVTTAQPWVCRYETDKIDLGTGFLNDATPERVQAVRFRKALTTGESSMPANSDELPYRRFQRLAGEQERTVLVVNSSSLLNVLRDWKDMVVRRESPLPWDE